MRRRTLLSAIGAAGAAGAGKCVKEVVEKKTTVTDSFFRVSSVGDEGLQEKASYSFDGKELRLTGRTIGSNACKTAELSSAYYDSNREAIVVEVSTVDMEAGGENIVCAQVLTAIEYEAAVEFEGEVPEEVVIIHDGTTLPNCQVK
jgi:hypothetical protein